MSHGTNALRSTGTTALRPSRPVFTPPPAEDPRPGIPQPPRDPKVAVVLPVSFITSAKTPATLDGVESFQAADWETLWNLSEVAFLSPAGVNALHRLESALAAPSALASADLTVTTEWAYIERDEQLAQQVRYELAAGGAA